MPILAGVAFAAAEHFLQNRKAGQAPGGAPPSHPGTPPPPLATFRPDRVLYGTDFPNVPYAWDRELKRLVECGLPDRHLSRVLGENALELFGVGR
ncbi:MAG: amidohydrolase family protein [Alphaproteobacteria bacterium]|nr:amidohydrolase family protein [Alphaproteobacteria bacterium]